jgi:uncharacterized protein YdaU (DUF1376 family)
MAGRPTTWMPLYVADYLADTAHLTAAQSGAYLHLIMAYWRAGGPLRLDDGALARTARMTPTEWSEAAGVVLAFFRQEDRARTGRGRRDVRGPPQAHRSGDRSEGCAQRNDQRYVGRNEQRYVDTTTETTTTTLSYGKRYRRSPS